ncbi:MAG: hypothetical protein ACLTGI_00005 [Hoylesella buccalis]
MKINTDTVTLVDQVEHSLLNYFKDNDLRCGDPIPNEHQLADEFGVEAKCGARGIEWIEDDGMINSATQGDGTIQRPPVLKRLRESCGPMHT